MARSPRNHRLAVTTVALLVLALGAQPVGAGGDGGRRTRHVEVNVAPPVAVGGDFACDPTDASRCVGTFRNLRTLSGDFTGTAYQVGAASPLPDGTYQGAGVVLFTGSVAGCGSGTLVIVETGRLDPITGAARGTWRISAGQGTGELAHVTGSLSADSRIRDVTAGRIRCK